MNLVVDASAVGSLMLDETVLSLRDCSQTLLSDATIFAPPHWPIELASVVLKAIRNDRLTVANGDVAWARASVLIASAEVAREIDASSVFELARSTGLSAQDAAYLDLARRHGVPLLTGDKALARAARDCGVALPFDPNA